MLYFIFAKTQLMMWMGVDILVYSHMRGFRCVSVLSEPDNKRVRSPCFMIKGLCSLATVCPQKREGTQWGGDEKKKTPTFYQSQPELSILLFSSD